MNVEGQWRRAIELADDTRSVIVLDQARLPYEITWMPLAELEHVVRAIRDMHIRGAPLIGATAAYGIAIAMRADPSDEGLARASAELATTRPTAINLRWAIEAMRAVLGPLAAADREAAGFAAAARICDDDVAQCEAIGGHGLDVIRAAADRAGDRPVRILTHCNAGWLATVDWGTALSPIYKAFEAGIHVHVWVDETRPRNQGMLTAWELVQHGVPHTVIADNQGGHLMQRGEVDLCIVGTDRTTRNGDVCNKIGTYLKALAAHDNDVPFYAAVPSPSIDWTVGEPSEIPIEERSGDEMRYVTGRGKDGAPTRVEVVPAQSAVANAAFDVTPRRLVTGLITERGVTGPAGLRALFFREHKPVTMRLRDELVKTARRMSDLGLTPGMSGNVSVRSPVGMIVTPSGMPYADLTPDDLCEMKMDGTVRPGQSTPSTEWQLHRDILGARQDVAAIVHTHSLFCTTVSMLRRPIPAVHYMIVLAGSDEIPCAEYATFGSSQLALNAVSSLRGGSACLLANHGMIALGNSLPAALRLAAEVETVAAQYWHAESIGTPHVLDRDELLRVHARFAEYGQRKPRTKRSW